MLYVILPNRRTARIICTISQRHNTSVRKMCLTQELREELERCSHPGIWPKAPKAEATDFSKRRFLKSHTLLEITWCSPSGQNRQGSSTLPALPGGGSHRPHPSWGLTPAGALQPAAHRAGGRRCPAWHSAGSSFFREPLVRAPGQQTANGGPLTTTRRTHL